MTSKNRLKVTAIGICVLLSSTSVMAGQKVFAQPAQLTAQSPIGLAQDNYAAIWSKSSGSPWVSKPGCGYFRTNC
jgi:hypothetical protein